MKPLLKYIGGKRKLAPIIAEMVDPTKRLVEPFAGSAALTFYMEPQRALLIDANPDLILFYSALKHKTDAFWRRLQILRKKVSRDDYNALRYKYKSRFDAATFYYLNRVGFRGMFRTNRSGEFNVPFGNYKNLRFMNREELDAATSLLKRVGVVCQDALRFNYIEKGDALFVDPPYFGTFDSYTKEGFTDENHKDLAQRLEELRAKGHQIIATNSDCKEVRKLYPKSRWKYVEAASQVFRNAKGSKNKPELILVAK